MDMDKSWMSVSNRISPEYKNGVRMFVARAVAYANEEGKISCPCNNCLNHRLQPLRLVEIHLIQYGIQQSYKVWDYHGEQYEHPSIEHETLSDSDVHDEMTDVLADLSGPIEIGEYSEPKLSVAGGSRATNLRLTCHDDSEKISTMQKTIDEQKQIIDEQHKKFEALLQQLQQVIPGFSFHAPPT
ncbi:hypothetical protein F511_43974 [Dorcoceras hygrometricum]|uniref:Transposase-associated domain-containing protein n=1 Tax=Dorcoceras hygrometricum TaxID=472368 RepID=A0A2Z6ZZH4_9LAMI|nr:hypothetical protein F511_43974 [Dorcoceras hygrometricum]